MELSKARKGLITGSRVGAILGVSKFATRDDVMRDMVREYYGAEKEFTGNFATDRGQRLESVAIQKYCEVFGAIHEPIQFTIHPTNDWLGATPDGKVFTSDGVKLIEVKCPMGNPKDSLESEQYYHQIQLQMHCTGFGECDLAVMDKDGNLFVRNIKMDTEWLKKYISVLNTFHCEYLSYCSDELLAKPFLDDAERDMADDIEFMEAAQCYVMYQKQMDELKEKQDWCKNRMESRLSNAKKATCKYLTMTKVQKDGSISYVKAIKELLPDADLSKYKGKPTEYTLIKITKEE